MNIVKIPDFLDGKSPLLDADLQEQLAPYLGKMPHSVTLKVVYDQKVEKSLEAANFYLSFAALSPQLNIELYPSTELPDEVIKAMQGSERLPFCTLFNFEGKPGKVSFRGIPGGKEINSFLLAILRLSGFEGLKPDQELLDAVQKLDSLNHPQTIQIMVSLACSHCSKMVENSQALAIASKNVSAEMIDATLYPDLIEKYSIKRVPMTFLDGVEVLGEKTSLEIAEILLEQANKKQK